MESVANYIKDSVIEFVSIKPKLDAEYEIICKKEIDGTLEIINKYLVYAKYLSDNKLEFLAKMYVNRLYQIEWSWDLFKLQEQKDWITDLDEFTIYHDIINNATSFEVGVNNCLKYIRKQKLIRILNTLNGL